MANMGHRQSQRWAAPLLLFSEFFASGAARQDAAPIRDNVQSPGGNNRKRAVTVVDAISMTEVEELRDPRSLSDEKHVALFSPDAKRFLVLVKHGNLVSNTNDYSVLMFESSDVFHSATPHFVVTFSSSSNRPGVQKLMWVDNNSIAFLGENPGEHQQLYFFNIQTHGLKRVTNQPTNVVSYAISPSRHEVFFTAETSVRTILTEDAQRNGIEVSSQLLSDLIAGDNEYKTLFKTELYVSEIDSDKVVRVDTNDLVPSRFEDILISPDEKYLLVNIFFTNIPQVWTRYKDRFLQNWISHKFRKDSQNIVMGYALIDIDKGHSTALISAPLGYSGSELLWSPDSRSVIVAGTFLPLNAPSAAERKEREHRTFVAEVRIPSMNICPISNKELRLVKWDASTNEITLRSTVRFSTVEPNGETLIYHKTEAGWFETRRTSPELRQQVPFQVVLKQSMNTRPQIIVRESADGRESLLLDPNPQFSELRFGRVEEVRFNATDGHEVKAGLYLPPEYVPGKKYPLVIQTHKWDPTQFWIDGPFTTAFAAQPLANKGFVVIQLPEELNDMSTPAEGPAQMSYYEGAINYLDRIGSIDRSRVGIIGFSRTCYTVKYTLTHSTYSFAAAVVTDGWDTGYFEYLAFLNELPIVATDAEGVHGGIPWLGQFSSWFRSAPGFRLREVRTPTRIVALGRGSLLSEWEWFSGLSRLGKPVDMVYLPDAAHVIVKPWERVVSQQGDVDWFCFWLKGEDDPDPAKAAQYARWRELRAQRESTQIP